jgi:hypothetical protein
MSELLVTSFLAPSSNDVMTPSRSVAWLPPQA